MTEARILFVGDDCSIAPDVKGRLRQLGYQVLPIVNSGEEALQRLPQTQPDLIVIDMELEGSIDGVRTAERIRERFAIPVIYLTGPADSDTMQRAAVTERLNCILKPVEEGELLSTVKMALDRRHIERKLRESEETHRALLEHSLQGIIIIQDSRIVFANSTFAQISGYTVEELMSLSPDQVRALVHPEDREFVWDRFQGRLEGRSVPQRCECRAIHRDGT
ncbi:MAG: response regulator, partial [Anaerolineae bacterium]